jgi:drug/metabolite transporter (DMT)-like permease
MKSNIIKGYLFALAATLAFSNVYIFSKAALNELPLAHFGSLWYLAVTMLCLVYAAFSKKLGQLAHLTRKQVYVLLALGGLEIATTTLFFLSVHIIPNPAVTSFLGNLYPLMVLLGGIFILHEKFSPIEIFGGFLALAGAFVISYSGGTTLKTFFIEGTGVVFFNAIFAATATLVVKIHVKQLSPEILNLNRGVWLLLFSFVMIFISDETASYSTLAIRNTLTGAFLEFAAILTAYYSFKFIDVSKSSIIQSLKGIVVMLFSFLFFRSLPQTHQIMGGLITVLGILIMALSQAGYFRNPFSKA